MTTNRSTAGRGAGGPSGLRKWARSPAAMFAGLALAALAQAGCQSSGCNDCGFGQKLGDGVQALGAKLFHHKNGCGGGGGGDCGCGGEMGTYSDPGVTVVPGAMALPGPASGTILPGPAFDPPPTQMSPIESSPGGGTNSNVGNPASNRSTPGGTNRSAYTTRLDRRNSAVSRAYEPATTPTPTPTAPDASSTDFLANVPPVDLSTEVATKAAKAPVVPASPAQPAPASTPPPASAPAPTSSPTPAADNAAPTPAEKLSAAGGAAASQAPGIRRYSSVAPSIGGGSAPTIEGLDWLKQKGCRTFVDLRKASEVDPKFVDAVNDRDMVYISLPILADRLEPNRLERFDDLISQSDNRPLYFCDLDGTRAALAWYLHLRNADREDAKVAEARAEEIGLNPADLGMAEDYLATHKPRARAALARSTPAPASPLPEPPPIAIPVPASSPASTPGPNPPAPTPAPVQPPTPSAEPTPPMLPGEGKPQASTEKPGPSGDPGSWRPVAALVLTGLGVPLAFWSRSAINFARSNRRRASLPGPAPRPSDAPAGSDA